LAANLHPLPASISCITWDTNGASRAAAVRSAFDERQEQQAATVAQTLQLSTPQIMTGKATIDMRK